MAINHIVFPFIILCLFSTPSIKLPTIYLINGKKITHYNRMNSHSVHREFRFKAKFTSVQAAPACFTSQPLKESATVCITEYAHVFASGVLTSIDLSIRIYYAAWIFTIHLHQDGVSSCAAAAHCVKVVSKSHSMK